MRTIEILATGPSATVQDHGRFGFLALGVGTSGAADQASFRLANRLVGNAGNAAVVECLLGGLAFRAHDLVVAAVTGAPAQAFVDGTPMGHRSTLQVAAGQTLHLAAAATGVRSYVAVRGGIDVEPVLGSRSTDTLAGIGPAALAAGDVLAIGDDVGPYPVVDLAPVREFTNDPVTIRVMLGPRDDWFVNPLDLAAAPWQVSSSSDRVGARLDRPAPWRHVLIRAHEGELPPEGAPLGAIQVPPSGQPVIFLADHPVSGGYPVIGVVRRADIDRVGQARPGQLIHILIP